MRIDKFLWNVRLFKTRSLAADQCKTNKILIKNEPVKSSKEIKIGDVISVKKNSAIFSYRVIELLKNRVGAALVKNYIEDITPETEIEKYKIYQEAQREYRENDFGKPTKSDRRKLNKFLED